MHVDALHGQVLIVDVRIATAAGHGPYAGDG